MKLNSNYRDMEWLGAVLYGIPQPGLAEMAIGWRIAELTRQGLAIVLSLLMVMIPMGQGDVFAQNAPPPTFPGLPEQPSPTPAGASQKPPQVQPLSADQLDQLVAPVALYPDQLLAQVLAASTYPTQVVEADRWLEEKGKASPEQIAAGADNKNWDPSVKALTAFPQVLAQMDKNIHWTTDLGNAYYNQPRDVMDAVQAMRQKALAAGQLRSTPQQTVTNNAGLITIAPADSSLVYIPAYDPWAVWGAPFPPYPDFYYYPPPDIVFGGLLIGFGVGIGIGLWAGWGWGWGHWGCGWHSHNVYYNHATYYTHSATVLNHGFNRPGGPGPGFGARGAYARPAGGFNRGAGFGSRYPGAAAGRPSGGLGHGAGGGHVGGGGHIGGGGHVGR